MTRYGTFCEIYVSDGVTGQSVPTGTTYVKSTAFTTDGLETPYCNADVANDQIVITKAGKYKISGSFSFMGDTNNIVWRGAAFVGGVEQSQVHWKRKVGTGADVGSASFTGFITATSSSNVDFRFRHDVGGTASITIEYANLNVEYIGE